MSKNIYNQREIKCPACQAVFVLKYPNPKLYAATARDEDQRVTDYSWTVGYKTDVLPHHYAILQCPNCLAADFQERLESRQYDSKAARAYTELQKLPFEKKIILRRLRRLVANDEPDAQAAVGLHLAAVFTALLPKEQKVIDHLKLGRLYLRLSWLFREINGDSAPKAGEDPEKDKHRTMAKSNALTKLTRTGEDIEDNMQSALDLMGDFRKWTEERTKELQLPGDKNPYTTVLDAVEDYLESALQELAQLEELVIKDKQKKLIIKKEKSKKDKAEDNEESTFEGLLETVAEQWPQCPKDEMSALKHAVDALEYSFKHEDQEQSIQQNMGLGALLMHLFIRVGDLDKALDLSVKLYKTGVRDKQSIQMQLNQAQRDGGFTDAEVKDMNRTIVILTNTLNKAAETRKKLIEQIYEREKDKITGILRDYAAAPPQQQMKALADAGISEEIINWLREKLPANNKKR